MEPKNTGKTAAVMLGIGALLTAVGSAISGLFDSDPGTPDWTLIATSVMAGLGLVLRGRA